MTTSTSPSAPNGTLQQPVLASQRQAQAVTPRKSVFFLLGYKEAVGQWWSAITPAVAEHSVLSLIPYLQKPPTHTQTGSAPPSAAQSTIAINTDPKREAAPVQTTSVTDPYGPRSWHSKLIQLSGKERALNEFSVQRDGEEVEETLVMLHGYGAGLGFFYKNFEGMSRVKGWKLYALDMLGMGRSSRPRFRIHAKDQQGKITEAENWFIDALEEWRILKKIDKFTLLGHSMGGYMAVAYALKYPGHLNKLILASPVGIPEDPLAVSADMPEPETSMVANELAQDQETDIVHANTLRNKSQPPNKKSSTEPPRKPRSKFFSYLWEANVSPFSLVRWAGPLGPRVVSAWTSMRFSHLPTEESQALHDYAYSLFRQRGSGEYALAYILAPGAFARNPLIRRINGVGRQMIPSTPSTATASSSSVTQQSSPSASSVPQHQRETGFPVVFMYGDHDWMDKAGGYAAQEELRKAKAQALKSASVEEKKREYGDARVVIIKNAGHHLYLEGWEEFNEVLRNEMEATKRDSRRRKAIDVKT